MARAPNPTATKSSAKKPKVQPDLVRSKSLRTRDIPSTAAEAKKKAAMLAKNHKDAKDAQAEQELNTIAEIASDSDLEDQYLESDFEDYTSHPHMPSFISEIFKRLDSHDALFLKLSNAYELIDSLKSELAAAKDTIAKLTADAVQRDSDTADMHMFPHLEKKVDDQSEVVALNGISTSVHASKKQDHNQKPSYSMAASNHKRAHARRPLSDQAKKAAARTFTQLSEDQGFKYLYVFARGKEPRNVVRSRLRKMGITPSRIIDIHYPAHQVMSLLIHNDYEKDLLQILTTYDITPLDNFDPKSEKHLNDTHYKDLSLQARGAKTEEIYSKRLINTILRVTPKSLQVALTRSFLTQKWLTEAQCQALMSHIYPKQEKSSDRDTSLVDSLFSGVTPTATNNSQAAGNDAAMLE